MQSDTMKIIILADGTIKTITDPVSQANHQSAESFLKTVAELAGGSTTREKRPDAKQHHHHHEEGEHIHH
jgi:hypothetical protein